MIRYSPDDNGPKKKAEVELDDKKSKKGLGELYEDDFIKARAGPEAEDEETDLHREAKALLKVRGIKTHCMIKRLPCDIRATVLSKV